MWQRLADTLLAREAALCRIVAGIPPRDFAGMFVDDVELTRVLATLPGLNGPPPQSTVVVVASFAKQLQALREEFCGWLASAPPDDDRSARVLHRAVVQAGLRPDEAEILALVAAVELDRGRQRLTGYVQDDVQLSRLGLATLNRIHRPDPAADGEGAGAAAVGPGSRLARAQLLQIQATGPWATRLVTLPTRLAWALNGDSSAEPDLPAGAIRLEPATRAGRTAEPARPARLLLICGADPQSRLLTARNHRPDRGLLVSPPPATDQEWAAVVREATLSRLTVLIRLPAGPAPFPSGLSERVTAAAHLSWILDSPTEPALESLPPGGHDEIVLLDGTAQDDDWQAAFGATAPPGRSLDRTQLLLVAAAAGADPARIPVAVRRLAGGHLEGVAVRVRPRRNWADLVLPADQIQQLRELASRHRHRSLVHGDWGFPAVPSTGTVALFAGPSGTGKTLAAEVVAAELGLDLYKVDLSAVVSKYIGETEKNLERIFSAAAGGDMVLFFDEADAIFGKRSEVSDAHDRYANIEVAYLLQRLETYNGMVVLATNLQRNIDQAFLRRIAVALDFVPPDEQGRRDIWRRSFPPSAPLGDVDLSDLAARFKVTGGMIRNVALAAAFQAADEQAEQIGPEHIRQAMRREYQKLGRLLTDTDVVLRPVTVQA